MGGAFQKNWMNFIKSSISTADKHSLISIVRPLAAQVVKMHVAPQKNMNNLGFFLNF